MVAAHRRYTAWNVEPTAAKLPTLRAAHFEKLGALVRGLDLAQLACRDVGIESSSSLVRNSTV
jgi:hypothetical protein